MKKLTKIIVLNVLKVVSIICAGIFGAMFFLGLFQTYISIADLPNGDAAKLVLGSLLIAALCYLISAVSMMQFEKVSAKIQQLAL